MESQQITNPIKQVQPYGELGANYGFVQTQAILDKLHNMGWQTREEKVAGARKPEKIGFQRHIVRLINDDFQSIPGLTKSNESRPELCLLNSHDGTTRLRILFGILRMACLNGIIAGTSLREFSTVHSGDLIKKLQDGVDYMTTGIPEMIEQVTALQAAKFSATTTKEFTKRLVDLRLQTATPTSVDYESALKVLRSEDAAEDAFTVFNRVQEKLIRGGIGYTYNKEIKDESGLVTGTVEAHRVTRKLTSIPQAIKLNRAAYDLAVQMAA